MRVGNRSQHEARVTGIRTAQVEGIQDFDINSVISNSFSSSESIPSAKHHHQRKLADPDPIIIIIIIMASTFVSYLNITDSLVSGPVPIAPFIPNSANLFPKMTERINETAWELWYFDGVTADASTAITISFFRDARAPEQGFRTQVNAIWPDGTMWGDELYFPESIITAEEESDESQDSEHQSSGRVKGTWRSSGPDGAQHATFEVAPDLSSATLTFDVPSRVCGTMKLTAPSPPPSGSSSSALPSEEDLALLGPSVYYVRPMPIASVTADLTFSFTPDKKKDQGGGDGGSTRELRITSEDKANGGMDRFWTPLAWPQLMTESYYLRATVGEYKINVMRIISSAATGKKPYVSARLYRNDKVVCAAEVIGESDQEDHMTLEKRYGDEKSVTGAFRDKNTGYALDFFSVRPNDHVKKHWRFDVGHSRSWWNTPTSAPGVNGTGNSGFVEKVVGGEDERERFEGSGGGGQAELP